MPDPSVVIFAIFGALLALIGMFTPDLSEDDPTTQPPEGEGDTGDGTDIIDIPVDHISM